MVSNTPEGKPVYVSYLAMQRLGQSIWSFCQLKQETMVHKATTGHEVTQKVHCQPSRNSIVLAGVGMLQVWPTLVTMFLQQYIILKVVYSQVQVESCHACAA